jgi:hypothetical protein
MADDAVARARQDFEHELKNTNAPVFPNLDDIHAALRAQAKANVTHVPRQQGPYLVCVSCTNQHTISYVGSRKKLVGLDQGGNPILENRF